MYSLDGKAKNARRRKNPKGSNNSSSTSPPGDASPDARPAPKKGQDSTVKAGGQDERQAPAPEQVRQSGTVVQDMTNLFTAGSSPTGSFEDDFIFTDEILNDFLPDLRGQNVYEYLNASNIPSQTEIDREAMFLDGVFDLDHVDSMNPNPAPCTFHFPLPFRIRKFCSYTPLNLSQLIRRCLMHPMEPQ